MDWNKQVKLGSGGGIIFLPGILRPNMLSAWQNPFKTQMAISETVRAGSFSKAKVIVIKIIALTAISLALVFRPRLGGAAILPARLCRRISHRFAGRRAHAGRVAGIVGGKRCADLRAEQRGPSATKSATFWVSTPAARFSSASPSGSRGDGAQIYNLRFTSGLNRVRDSS